MTENASLGERRVRTTFNPSNNSMVDQVKQDTAKLINLLGHAPCANDPEAHRLFALAMTAYEEAAMWAVKALTSAAAAPAVSASPNS